MGNSQKLKEAIRRCHDDYVGEMGRALEGKFFCPILFEEIFSDEDVCWGHVVPEKLGGATTGVPQSKKVDNFFGSVFEAQCRQFELAKTTTHLRSLLDKTAFAASRPKVLVDGMTLTPVPLKEAPVSTANFPGYLEIQMSDSKHIFGLKGETTGSSGKSGRTVDFQVLIEMDSRVGHCGMAMHSAHLTMFSLLGYRYVFSTSGRFYGEELGRFFRDCGGSHSVGRERASQFAEEFKNFYRPVTHWTDAEKSSVDDRTMLLFLDIQKKHWAVGVFVQASTGRILVVVPTMETPDSVATALQFKEKGSKNLTCRVVKLNEDRSVFGVSPDSFSFEWPDAVL